MSNFIFEAGVCNAFKREVDHIFEGPGTTTLSQSVLSSPASSLSHRYKQTGGFTAELAIPPSNLIGSLLTHNAFLL
jgi:hypothetical protein